MEVDHSSGVLIKFILQTPRRHISIMEAPTLEQQCLLILLCYLYNYPSPCCLPGFAISSSATFPLWTLIPQHELTFPSFHPGIVVRFCVQERATEYYTDMYSYLSTEDPSSSKWWKYSLTASAVRACLR